MNIEKRAKLCVRTWELFQCFLAVALIGSMTFAACFFGAATFRLVSTGYTHEDLDRVFPIFTDGGWVGALVALPLGLWFSVGRTVKFIDDSNEAFLSKPFFTRLEPPCAEKTPTSPRTPQEVSCECSSPPSTKRA